MDLRNAQLDPIFARVLLTIYPLSTVNNADEGSNFYINIAQPFKTALLIRPQCCDINFISAECTRIVNRY